MRRIVFALLLSVSVTAHSSAPRRLTDADVDEAIVLGRANALSGITAHCVAERASWLGPAIGGIIGAAIQVKVNQNTAFDVNVFGSRGRIARAAWDATRAGTAFTRADVPGDWREPVFYASVAARMPNPSDADAAMIPAAIRTIFIRAVTPAKNDDLQPLAEVTPIPRTWKAANGATVDYAEALARFDLGYVLAMSDDRLTFTVVTEAGPRSCDLTARQVENAVKDRKVK